MAFDPAASRPHPFGRPRAQGAPLRGATGLLGALAGAFVGAAVLVTPGAAFDSSDSARALAVTVDRARVVRIAKPADTIIIGNPAIVDATIQDARNLVLTGRSFGITNLIVLDTDGDPIVEETIVVKAHEANSVRIYRRAERETLACSPVCEPTATIGDQKEAFDSAIAQTEARNRLQER